ncbi:MAG TPA: hypothetical protein IGS40_19870 [Trichormus sp. M33_DOE_039]|nr:hypothetical protein [Trichormus sp. M33_DOE_039]
MRSPLVCKCDRFIISTTSVVIVILPVKILGVFFVQPNQDKAQEFGFSETC